LVRFIFLDVGGSEIKKPPAAAASGFLLFTSG
jgi:hypothetical protein